MPFVSPLIADIMLWLMYIAFALAVIVTGVSLVRTLRLRTKDDEVVNGVLFTDAFWLKAADMFIYTSLILIIGCFAGVVLSRFRN